MRCLSALMLLGIIGFVVPGCNDDNGNGNDKKEEEPPPVTDAPPAEITEPTLPLTGFEMQSSLLATEPGATISTAAYVPQAWYTVEVPTTVLRGLVLNGVYPDPNIGLNNMLIPDSNDQFNVDYDLLKYSHIAGQNPWRNPYHFRTVFQTIPEFEGKRIWLNFNGINYRADVWLNGAQVAVSSAMVGMFGSFKYDVTDKVLVGQDNVLAVTIHPVDHPGTPDHEPLIPLGGAGDNCGIDSGIAQDVTMHCSLGWDWIPVIRDRSMGIWQEVFLNATEPVDVKDSDVKVTFPATGLAPVTLALETTLQNPTAAPVAGKLWAVISPANFEGGEPITLSQDLTVPANTETIVAFTADKFPALNFADPKLWWPYQYGAPNLYELKMIFVSDTKLSDAEVRRFGIRKITTRVDQFGAGNDADLRRTFWINDQRVALRGGAWVPDMLLHRDRARYEKELRFTKEANLNTVRIWGGGVTPPEEFFDIADELGILVWSDFWVTGDGQGTWDQGSRDWPLEANVFLMHADNVIKRIRHHASLFVWVGGNEGYSRAEIYNALRNSVVTLDGTRPFLPSTGPASEIPDDFTALSYPDNAPPGTYSGSPHIWVPLDEYSKNAISDGRWLMNNEVGLPTVPPIRSVVKFINDLVPDPDADLFPLNSTWAYHDAADAEWGNDTYSDYHEQITVRFGAPTTLEDYVMKAQFISADSLRAIFEAVNSQISRNSGLLMWKTNSSWPSVLWQIYDWYLRPVAGYYWVKKANELLRIQYDPTLKKVRVSNRQVVAATGLTAELLVYDQEMAMVSRLTSPAPFTVEPETAYDAFVDWELPAMDPVPDPDTPPSDEVPAPTKPGVAFVKLNVKDATGAIVTDNFYWMQQDNNFRSMRDLPQVDLTVTAAKTVDAAGELVATVNVTNPSDSLVFFTQLVLLNGAAGEEVLPTYWSDNFFVLMPGEAKTVTATVRATDIPAAPVLSIEGWNTVTKQIPL